MTHIQAASVLGQMRATILVTDRLGTILQAHGGSGRPLGYLPGELTGRHGIELIAPEDHEIMADTYLASSGDLPLVAAPRPFPLRIVGPDGAIRTWDCAPNAFEEDGQVGWIMTLTCRIDQNPSSIAMDCFIAGGSPLDIAHIVAGRHHGRTDEGWQGNALVLSRDLGQDGSLEPWQASAPAGTHPELLQALDGCIDDPIAPWNRLEPGSMESDSQLPSVLCEAAERVGLPCCTSLAIGTAGATRIVFVRLSNLTPELQLNNKLADKALDAILRRALEAESARAALDQILRSDPLTGIANRHHFDGVIADTSDVTHQAVLYVDIDQFKSVNDTYGHAAGDETLCEVANRIERACRPQDFVSRVGGDEFAIVLRDVRGRDAEIVAARIRMLMQHPLNLTSAGPEYVTVTIGIGVPSQDSSLADLVKTADLAMLANKTRHAEVDAREPQVAPCRRAHA